MKYREMNMKKAEELMKKKDVMDAIAELEKESAPAEDLPF